jgi:hypothetical protein
LRSAIHCLEKIRFLDQDDRLQGARDLLNDLREDEDIQAELARAAPGYAYESLLSPLREYINLPS